MLLFASTPAEFIDAISSMGSSVKDIPVGTEKRLTLWLLDCLNRGAVHRSVKCVECE